jgi:hypothetical protein
MRQSASGNIGIERPVAKGCRETLLHDLSDFLLGDGIE